MRTEMTVQINKQELIDKLVANSNKHLAVFEEAHDGYRKAVIEAMETNLAAAREGSCIRTYIELREPQDHRPDYARALQMLTMEIRDIVELTHYDFCRFVLDEWEWTNEWTDSTTMYMGK